MYSQEQLRTAAARRITATTPGAASAVPTGAAELAELIRQAGDAVEQNDTVAVAVLRSFDPAAFAASSVAFAAGIESDRATDWYRAFTRTIFLTGNPANLSGRFTFDHASPDGTIAWVGPQPSGTLLSLRRLLPLFAGTRELDLPAEIAVHLPGGTGGEPRPPRVLHVATAGVGLADYLVHVNHVLAEATLAGLVGPGDELLLRHVPRLSQQPYALLRVHVDTADPSRLRAYAGLTYPAANPDDDTRRSMTSASSATGV